MLCWEVEGRLACQRSLSVCQSTMIQHSGRATQPPTVPVKVRLPIRVFWVAITAHEIFSIALIIFQVTIHRTRDERAR